jgi:hypothetical protein
MAARRGVNGALGTALYLAPAWTAIPQTLTAASLFPSPERFKAAELRICDAGNEALLAMWGRLGLTPEIYSDQQFAIWVSKPQR